MKILVIKRNSGYAAYLQGRLSMVGIGKSAEEAIGNLVRCNRDVFEVTIEDKSQQKKDETEDEDDDVCLNCGRGYDECDCEDNIRDFEAQQKFAQTLPAFIEQGDTRFFS